VQALKNPEKVASQRKLHEKITESQQLRTKNPINDGDDTNNPNHNNNSKSHKKVVKKPPKFGGGVLGHK
jgi:hypothetical protein